MDEMKTSIAAIDELGREWSEFKTTHLSDLAKVKGAVDGLIADSARRRLGGSAAPDAATATASEWRDADGKPMVVLSKADSGRMAHKMSAGEPDFTLGDFFRAVAGMKTSEPARKALAVGTDSAGGFAVPSMLLPQFLEALAPASSVIQAGGQVLPLDAQGKTFRIVRVGTIPTAGWRSENGAVAESDPAFAALDLTPQSLAFYFKVSRELLADAPNLDMMLQSAIAQAFAAKMDLAALRGSGTPPEPRGLLNISGVGSVTNGAAGAALGTIKWSNLLSATQTILEANAPMPTAAIMAPRTLTGFGALADSTGQPLRRPDLLERLNLLTSSQIPVNLTVGGSTDCSELYVGDFRNFVFGLREDVAVLRADQLFATSGQVGFICHARVDVGVTYPAAFVKVTGIRP